MKYQKFNLSKFNNCLNINHQNRDVDLLPDEQIRKNMHLDAISEHDYENDDSNSDSDTIEFETNCQLYEVKIARVNSVQSKTSTIPADDRAFAERLAFIFKLVSSCNLFYSERSNALWA